MVTGRRMASAVMVVTELDRSVVFYEELPGWQVAVSDESVALLIGPEVFSCISARWGVTRRHPLGFVGIQYLG
jgi:hypothetical protein